MGELEFVALVAGAACIVYAAATIYRTWKILIWRNALRRSTGQAQILVAAPKAGLLNLHRSASRTRLMTPEQSKHMWIITGPAGSGKTTVAKYLATELDVPYVEGDDWHPKSNKDKMRDNIPLTDGDRWDWLGALREESLRQLQTSDNVVVTCSALKHKYRDVMRVASVENHDVEVHFIYLKVDEATLKERVAQRQDHYMKDSMVQSQMEALEEPDLRQEPDVIPVESRKDAREVQRNALEQLKSKLREY